MNELTRTYRCPACGYDGLKAGAPKSPVDVNIRYGCPACKALRGLTVWLEETSDPRSEAS